MLKEVKSYDICNLLSHGPEVERNKCVYIYVQNESENRRRGKTAISNLKNESTCLSK